jgi:formylglycine-generating enzyme required for sulfatase activity
VANNITSRATTPALGGGVYLTNGGKIYNSLIVNNMANNGYGVYGEAGCIITNATIIYNTFAPISVLVPGTGANLSNSNTTNYYFHQANGGPTYNTTVKVQLTDFYLSATETTCLQYCVFLAGVDYRVESNVIILADTYRDSLWTLKVYGAGITGQTDNNVVRLYYGTDIRPSSQSDEDYCANYGYELCYTNPNSNVSDPNNFGFLYQNSGIIVPKERTGGGTIPDDDISICYVSWYGSMVYSQWLGGSLPTEAQWEFALRRKNASAFVAPVLDNTTIAGQSSSLHNEVFAYEGGSSESVLSTYAWYGSNSADAATSAAYGSGSSRHNHKVGEKAPIGLGLYDMNGNLSEWCADFNPGTYSYALSHYNYSSGNDMVVGDVMLNPINNAVGANSPPSRVLRGSGWLAGGGDLRVGYRGNYGAYSRDNVLGFRPAFLSPFAP